MKIDNTETGEDKKEMKPSIYVNAIVLFSTLAKCSLNISPNTTPLQVRTNLELLTHSAASSVSKCSKHIVSPTEKNALELLSWFVQELKDFVTPEAFAFRPFQGHVESLYGQLDEIESWIRSIKPIDTGVLYQLQYLKHMFESMVSATVSLQYFDSVGNETHIYLRQIIDLNIRQFALRDSFGVADPTIANYDETLDRLSECLHKAVEISHLVSLESFSVILMFKAQFEHAEMNYRDLTAGYPHGVKRTMNNETRVG